MKLITKNTNYTNPNFPKWNLDGVTSQDTESVLKRQSKYRSITFSMIDTEGNCIYSTTLGFDENSSKSSKVAIDNPDYVEGSELPERIEVHLMQYLADNNYQLQPNDVITNCGYPSYEEVHNYFEGSDFGNEEINVRTTLPPILRKLAEDFILNTLVINGEKVGVQFKFE